MRVALAGGVGAARLLSGLSDVTDPSSITAIVNTGDDMVLHGLHISPDIDTVTYTLAGMHNEETGWGIAGETFTVMGALEGLNGQTWFRLGDRDLATHLYRSQRLDEGATISAVTSELVAARDVAVRILPMTDDPVRTRVILSDPQSAGSEEPEISFQDYFVRLAHSVPVAAVHFAGSDEARPAPGVLEAIEAAEEVIACPSNPIVSIGPILSIPGIEEALRERRDAVVAVSPIVAGQALKGPADRLLTELGHESSAAGVARLYAPWAGTLVIDEADAALRPRVEAEGMRCIVAPTIMSSRARAAALAKVVLDACW